MTEKMAITKMKEGTVIDHIPHGLSLKILSILNIDEKHPNRVALMMGVGSKKMSKKDLLKVEGREVDSKTLGKIAVIAPDASINIIKNYDVVDKHKLTIPDELLSILKCPNPLCITNKETIGTRFYVENKKPLKIRCHYCERVFDSDIAEKTL